MAKPEVNSRAMHKKGEKMIQRTLLNQLLSACFKGKIILLFGARQVGKTTLLKQLVNEISTPFTWFNADEADVSSL